MPDAITVTLPWPAAGLVPHSSGGWRAKSALTKRERSTSRTLTIEALGRAAWPESAARLVVTLHPPHRRGDVQNTIGALKAAIDGIADALRVNDRRFRISWPEGYSETDKVGRVVVDISPISEREANAPWVRKS